MILVLGATGMFGSRVGNSLTALGQPYRALVRDEGKARAMLTGEPELVIGDLDRPETLPPALAGIERLFLVTAMDAKIADRELAVIAAAKTAGVRSIVKLYGAVHHDGDPLDVMHRASIAALGASGLDWVLACPNSVTETSLYGQLPALKATGQMWGCAGSGRVGMVAADDVGRAVAAVLAGQLPRPNGTSLLLTGPESLTMAEIATEMTDVLGRPISYTDLPEEQFLAVLTDGGMSAEEAEIGVVSHFRAWRNGGADVVTDTVQSLTGQPPTSVQSWLEAHRADFG